MSYTVQKLAKLSGVSIRTLHFYDEIGLLQPAYIGANGYRYYEEKELLLLQQILFFRELGFELKKIQKIIGKGTFDQIAALQSHRKILQNNLERTKELIATINKTMAHLSGGKKMKDQELYHGFITEEKQAEYEEYLINSLGNAVKDPIQASKQKMKQWSKADWDLFSKEWDAICKELAQLFEQNFQADSAKMQKVIRRHYEWLPWTGSTCTKEAYIGLGQGYTGFEWKKAFAPYDSQHPRLAKFMAEAMKIFADRELKNGG